MWLYSVIWKDLELRQDRLRLLVVVTLQCPDFWD